jgi:hypothetical protein
MADLFLFSIYLTGGIIVLLITTFTLRKLIWLFRFPFYFLNYLQWFLYNPLRFLLKNPNSELGRRLFIFLNTFFIAPIYWLIIHFFLTPVRVVNSLYFDVLVYWSVMLDDTLREVFMPKLGKYRHERGFKYCVHWLFALPFRLLKFLARSFFTVFDSVLMLGISIVLPTLTMYHGTKFNSALTKIVQDGRWLVGGGDHAGSGIYFAISRQVARHYSPSGEDKGILILRITPTFTRNQVTLKKEFRELVGTDGRELSQKLSFPFYTIEHWRTDMNGWWEYCLVQPNKAGQYIKTWRIRPIAVLKDEDHKITRVWGGMRHYCLSFSNCAVGVICWGIIFVGMGILKN